MRLIRDEENTLYTEYDKERITESETERARTSHRDAFERDHGRIVHSSAFRRLQAKTQVIGIGEGDYHRTRLTHSMEVAQIARGTAITLNYGSELLRDVNGFIDSSIIETAALAHDIGHPPFGHKGERALNKMMADFGGFEGNAQTFRILTRLEAHLEGGLRLTRASLLSILKYPILFSNARNQLADAKPPKSNVYDEDNMTFEWLLKEISGEEREYILDYTTDPQKHARTLNKSLECSIIELADDIAYGTHDVQDGMKLGFITLRDLQAILSGMLNYCPGLENVSLKVLNLDDLYSEANKTVLHQFFADLINYLVNSITLKEINSGFSPRFRFKVEMDRNVRELLDKLSDSVLQKVIRTQQVQTMEWKGGLMIEKMFEAMLNDNLLLPPELRKKWSDNKQTDSRLVCDYIAGMTDTFALTMYSRLFDTKSGHLFDIG